MSCFFLSTDRNRGVFFSVAIPEATYEKSYDGLCTFVGFYSRLDPSARGASSATRGLTRLFVPLILTGQDERGKVTVNSVIARRTEFWWNSKRPDESTLWESKIELSEDFFNEIIQHPVPIDMNTLTALKRCSLGLDLYLWLVYRTFPLRVPQRITWKQVYRQFGADPDKGSNKFTVRSFREKVLRELNKIKLAWSGLNYTTAPGLLILLPSTPAIAPLNQGQLPS